MRIFWRPLRCNFYRWTLVCTVAAKLHNYCIDMDDTEIAVRDDSDYRDYDAPDVFMNDAINENDDSIIRRPVGDRRREITRRFESLGVRRPLHAMVNTRAN